MSKNPVRRRKPQPVPPPNQTPMIPEFDYQQWVVPYGENRPEIAEYLNDASNAGWNLQSFQESFLEDKLVVTALLVRGKERKVLGAVGLA